MPSNVRPDRVELRVESPRIAHRLRVSQHALSEAPQVLVRLAHEEVPLLHPDVLVHGHEQLESYLQPIFVYQPGIGRDKELNHFNTTTDPRGFRSHDLYLKAYEGVEGDEVGGTPWQSCERSADHSFTSLHQQ